MTRVSIVIPAYNAEAFIERALHSALNQTERDIEVLVVDDASTDKTADLVASLASADGRLKLIPAERNKGNYAARNLGIGQARGEWIANLDADDWYLPDRLERLLAAESESPAEIISDNLAFITEGATEPWQTLIPTRGPQTYRMTPETYLEGDMLDGEKSLGLFHPIIRRSFLVDHGLQYRSDVRTGGDSEFLLRCLAKTEDMLVVRQPCYFYLVRPDSVSRTRSADQLRQLRPHFDDLVHQFEHKPAMQSLLRERSRRLQTYIRVKTIVDPIRGAEWRRAVSALGRDLGVLPALTRYLLYWIWIRLRKWSKA